jgi:hypothetical protein
MLHYTILDACLTSVKYCSNRVKIQNVQVLSLTFNIIFSQVHCVNPTDSIFYDFLTGKLLNIEP